MVLGIDGAGSKAVVVLDIEVVVETWSTCGDVDGGNAPEEDFMKGDTNVSSRRPSVCKLHPNGGIERGQ